MPSNALILRTAGTNCDLELARAFELAGASASVMHLNELIADPAPLQSCDFIGLPGGFSYGDDISAGRIFANRLRHRLWQPLLEAVERGAGVIGICNGFQVLVKLGLLPDPHAGRQTVTLAENTSGRFIDRWVRLTVNPASPCLWTHGLDERIALPVAHGEGRLTADPATLDQLHANGQIALRYAEDDDPNGSARHIAGLCDATGRILGLMPHPERCLTRHQPPAGMGPAEGNTPVGFAMFQQAVNAIAANRETASRATL